MNNYLARILSEMRSARFTRRGATHDPKDVPTGTHKEYLRMERIALPEPEKIEMSLSEALERRISTDFAGVQKPLSHAEYGTLLGNTLKRRKGSTKRNYPSGGALYPIETYIFQRSDELSESGVFHYHPTAHALEKLWDFPKDFDIKTLAQFPEELKFSALVVFTSVWTRSSAKYGDLAFLHALIESGHMSQNIVLAATAIGLETRPMAGFNDSLITALLDLDSSMEQPVHSIVLGKR